MKIRLELDKEETFSSIGLAKAITELSFLEICDILEISKYLKVYADAKEFRSLGGVFEREANVRDNDR